MDIDLTLRELRAAARALEPLRAPETVVALQQEARSQVLTPDALAAILRLLVYLETLDLSLYRGTPGPADWAHEVSCRTCGQSATVQEVDTTVRLFVCHASGRPHTTTVSSTTGARPLARWA